MSISEFSLLIQQLVADMPVAWALHLANILADEPAGDRERLRLCMLQGVRQTHLIERIEAFCDAWQNRFFIYTPQSVALSLLAIAQAVNKERQSDTVSLVWTGPDSDHIPLRRTEQVLLQLIRAAKEHLLIVSFAVYKAKIVLSALEEAIYRGVQTVIVLESPDASAGKIGFDPLQSFEKEILEQAQFYLWPHDKRPLSPDGKHGSLHAKVAVADENTLFITSANLTNYAMNLNMELGVLIRGGELPKQVEGHFEGMIMKNVISKVQES
jgi:phosphatidylserine/phosphatidylglycerophosphate/cardiolipin synthase-like enzyme